MKKRIIKAIKIAINRTDDEIFNKNAETCPLCKLCLKRHPLSNGLYIWDCSICPSNSLRDKMFFFHNGQIIPHQTGCMMRNSFRVPELDRKYWIKRLPKLEKLNKKYFTIKGYDKQVFKKIMKDD